MELEGSCSAALFIGFISHLLLQNYGFLAMGAWISFSLMTISGLSIGLGVVKK